MRGTGFAQSTCIVEPRLWTAEGHEFDHVIEFARGVKAFDPDRRVVVLTGPQDSELAAALQREPSIDATQPCFTKRWIGDMSPFSYLVKASFQDSMVLRSALKQHVSTKKVILFFTSLALYQLLMLAFLRLTMPLRRIGAIGVFRYDPLDAAGRLKRKYRFMTGRTPGRILWNAALKDTLVYTDSPLLQRALNDSLEIRAGLAPIPVPGVWDLLEHGLTSQSDNPLKSDESLSTTVGFIGQPRQSRSFDLFVLSALAMENERRSGKLQFLAVVPPGSMDAWGTTKYSFLLRAGLPGLTLEERWMSSKEFARQMNRVNIVWALGDQDIYRRQTSGIFTHAICLGKRAITNRGGSAHAMMRASPMVQFVYPLVEQVVAGLRCLMSSERDSASLQEVIRWRLTHSRKAFREFVATAVDTYHAGPMGRGTPSCKKAIDTQSS